MLKRLTPEVIGMTIFLIICCVWSHILFFAADPWILLDNANFMVHEIGHLMFIFFDEFIMMLGGSLFQLLVPAIIAIYFGLKKSAFACGFGIFWLGNNFVNVARYIADARAQTLTIYGSGHDWNWILSRLDLLSQDTAIADVVYFAGRSLLVIALIIMAWAIWRKISKQSKYPKTGSLFEL